MTSLSAANRTAWSVAAAAAGALLAAAVACGADGSASPATGDGDGGASNACPPCVTNGDCDGGACVQLGADSFCAPTCAGVNDASCADGRSCVAASNVAGEQVSVCAPTNDECAGGRGSQDDAGAVPGACDGLAAPTVSAPCTSCTGKSNCQANGCYGGWWCNLGTNKCQQPPTTCGSSGAFDGGGRVTGTVGASGGKVSRLYFAVAGDTRPPTPDDTAGYPTNIITQIYQSLETLSPRPPFVVSTGDYIFATTGSAAASAQLDLYLGARAKFQGTLFPAMGNHECTGRTASNCGAGTIDGVTTQYDAFLSKMLGPVQKTDPYYTIRIDAQDGSWTSKFVFIAANAWTAAQASWLDGELAKPTTYTFVVRHESRYASQAPGVTPSEQIMAKHPYTLSLVGHTHTYQHQLGTKEVIIGNGGAPLTGSKNYGFALLQQRPDGAIQVDMLDYQTAAADTSFRFAVTADGTPAN